MEKTSISRSTWIAILFATFSTVFYFAFAYDLVRTDHFKLLTLYAAIFFFYLKIVRTHQINFTLLVAIAISFRLVFLFSIPNLSQDFYRFIWDGQMIRSGYNPYLSTPLSFKVNPYWPFNKADILLAGMGELNASHFTNYPPVNQLIFYITSWCYNLTLTGMVVALRIVIIAADIGTIFIGRKLLRHLKLDEKNIFWFALNPLVIIELTGNLHFEGIMIFFLIWSLYLLYKGKWFWSALILAISISTKLIPLMFLPLFYQCYVRENGQYYRKRWWPLFRYYLVVGSTTVLIFLPFYSSEFISNYSQTVGLWFQKFEFNASIYYILRELGFAYYGYNNIAYFGPILAILVVLFILGLSFIGKSTNKNFLIFLMMIALSCYLFTTTTVHPWYLTTLIALAVFTTYKYSIVWSATVVLSYLAYTTKGFYENQWWLILEYIPVFLVIWWEMIWKNKESLRAKS